MMADDKIELENFLSFPQEKKSDNFGSIIRQDGFWLICNRLSGIKATIEHFQPRPTDIILVSFPKTGTTWLKTLLYSIVHQSSIHQLTTNHVQVLVPTLERHVNGKPPEFPLKNPLNVGNSNDLPEIFHTHIPYKLLSRTLDPFKGRIVYVTRNPKDTIVSFWHFMNRSTHIDKEPWTIEMAVEKFCEGLIPYGPYYEHVLEYKRMSLKRPENVFFLCYEELKNDPISVVQLLASFLGFPIEGEERVEEIVNGCSFEVQSKHDINRSEESLYPTYGFSKNSFYRKGEVGDYKNILTQEMIEKIDAVTREKFHFSGFMYGI